MESDAFRESRTSPVIWASVLWWGLVMRVWAGVVGGGVALVSRVAVACTVCGSDTGRQVRAGVFDGHFGGTACAVLLPFAIFVALGVGVYFGMPELRVDEVEETGAAPERIGAVREGREVRGW